MRAHNDEHSNILPIIDISALKHIAYVFDALIYYMRSGTDCDADAIRDGISVHSWQDHDENENEEQDDDPISQNVTMETDSMDGESDIGSKTGRKHPFFHRSDSTTFLGCPPPDPFRTPLVEALPLADQPHILQPNARREDLFGIPKQPMLAPTTTTVDTDSSLPMQPSPFDRLPTHLALSVRTADTPLAHGASLMPFPAAPVEVASCSVESSTSQAEPPSSGTSVIVKPASSVLAPHSQLEPQVSVTSPPDEANSDSATVPANSESNLSTPRSASSSPSRPLVTQPSVIVHSGSAQPLVLPSGSNKEEEAAEKDATKPSPGTTDLSTDQPSTSTPNTAR